MPETNLIYEGRVNTVIEHLYELLLSGGGDASSIREIAEEIVDSLFPEKNDD